MLRQEESRFIIHYPFFFRYAKKQEQRKICAGAFLRAA